MYFFFALLFCKKYGIHNIHLLSLPKMNKGALIKMELYFSAAESAQNQGFM